MNSHKDMDGIEFEELLDDEKKCYAIKCRIYRKDRRHPVTVTEYMEECKKDSEPWNKWPIRMLRHKAAIQCARVAFGFAGIVDEDEWGRMKDVTPQATAASEIQEEIEKEIQQQVVTDIEGEYQEAGTDEEREEEHLDHEPEDDCPIQHIGDFSQGAVI